jgi:signal transduction histidine kinase
MSFDVLLCDSTDEVDRLRLQLLRAATDSAIEVATDPFAAVEAAARLRSPVIVCEPSLEGMAPIEFVRRLRASSPASRIVAWTAHPDPEGIAEALGTGIAGYVLKADGPDELIRAIRSASGGGLTLSPSAVSMLCQQVELYRAEALAAREELTHVRASVSQGSSAKADFLANISHELRTPVTVAKGIAYVLRNPAVSEDERGEFLTQLQSSLDKLMGIVDEVITMAELERGTFELHRTEVDLAPLVRHAVDEVNMRYPEVPVQAEIAPNLVTIADGPRIVSVVRELLDNACRYSPAGHPVEVRARTLVEGVVVSVTDRGEGLHRSVATQSFEEPFTTGEGVLRKEKAGVGVGLHLARQMIVEHGGILWTDPLPGGGTRASFCLPAEVGARLELPPADVA